MYYTLVACLISSELQHEAKLPDAMHDKLDRGSEKVTTHSVSQTIAAVTLDSTIPALMRPARNIVAEATCLHSSTTPVFAPVLQSYKSNKHPVGTRL
jgi:hypothetical protein